LPNIGIYLPYSALHHILFHYMKHDALIMTSANLPGEPMVISNREAFSLNADYYLLHNRKIVNRIDDSVIKIWKNRKFFIRKSRGFIPSYIHSPHSKRIVGVGAEENVSGAISREGKIYSTQYIGDVKNYDTMIFLENSIKFYMNMLKLNEIDGVAVDLHPLYNTRKIGEKLAEKYEADIYEVQHHWAHAAALMLDGRIDEGVFLTLDGLGYGNDGKLWGGEVMYANFHEFKRLGHLRYIPLIGGDRATKDIKRIVFAIFMQFGEEIFFHGEKADVMKNLMKSSPQTSGMGRILDALSCYFGICTEATYDGEPAMKLERYLEKGKNKYEIEAAVRDNVVDTVEVFKQIHEIKWKKKEDIIYSSVYAIIEALSNIAIDYAEKKGIKTVGITGGVAYNLPIVEMVEEKIKKAGLNFLTHNSIPCGDGGVAVGQNAIGGMNA